ncbi:hypothetical protein Pint_35059 [Pistacia integerrima]|uniref:Uncharacterized protein n=1 Tax=Pistacia integerrima TaxID=434235 RepID=A0ACC0Y272_9ROSI|nr:hypothetical protein Pint_35059 [Pistacia integerrima]
MASPDISSPWISYSGESFCGSFDTHMEKGNTVEVLHVLEAPTSSVSYNCSIPKPPLLPVKACTKTKYPKRLVDCSCVPKETKIYGIIFLRKAMGHMFILLQRINHVFHLIREFCLFINEASRPPVSTSSYTNC